MDDKKKREIIKAKYVENLTHEEILSNFSITNAEIYTIEREFLTDKLNELNAITNGNRALINMREELESELDILKKKFRLLREQYINVEKKCRVLSDKIHVSEFDNFVDILDKTKIDREKHFKQDESKVNSPNEESKASSSNEKSEVNSSNEEPKASSSK
ncbi:MAG: hypothetical protein KAS12_01880 [Candidatus Aenigmarchaeota archaeon]|nr:hypothetical protein [Candidatus Aenigmarchaeota archaeon]